MIVRMESRVMNRGGYRKTFRGFVAVLESYVDMTLFTENLVEVMERKVLKDGLVLVDLRRILTRVNWEDEKWRNKDGRCGLERISTIIGLGKKKGVHGRGERGRRKSEKDEGHHRQNR